MIDAQASRTTSSRLVFKSPFSLGGEEVFPAGSYEVQTTEAIHELAERKIFRRISTVLVVATIGTRRYCEVDPGELEDAVARDR